MSRNNFNTTDVVPYITRIPARPGPRAVDQDVDLRPTGDLGQGSHVHRADPNARGFHADSSYLGYGAYATLDGSRVDSSEFADPDWAGAKLEPERPATPGAPHDQPVPRGSRPSNARIHDEICGLLLQDPRLATAEVEVSVVEGDVLLTGTVEHREFKHLAEDLAFRVSGVLDVTNQLRAGPLGAAAPEPAQDRWSEPAAEQEPFLVDRGGEDEEDHPDDLSVRGRRGRERRPVRAAKESGPRDLSRGEGIGKV